MNEVHQNDTTSTSDSSRELTAEQSAVLHRLRQAGAIADRLAATGRCHIMFTTVEVHKAVTQAVGHRNPSITILPADDPAVLNLARLLFTCWVMTKFDEFHPIMCNHQALVNIQDFRNHEIQRLYKSLEILTGLDINKVRAAVAMVDADIMELHASASQQSQMVVVTPVSWQFFAAFLAPAFVHVLAPKPGGNAREGKMAMYRFVGSIMPLLNGQQPTYQAVRSQLSRKRPVRIQRLAFK